VVAISALTCSSSSRWTLTDTTTTRDADVKYLADVTAACKLKPANFESRQQLRTKSLKWSRRQSRSCPAMTSAATEKHLPSLVQKTAVTQLRASTRGEVQQLAIEYLQIQGKRLNSRVLSALAVRISDDPSTQVKKMINCLIARLKKRPTRRLRIRAGTTQIRTTHSAAVRLHATCQQPRISCRLPSCLDLESRNTYTERL